MTDSTNGAENTATLVEVPTEPEVKTQTWRVLRRDPDTIPTVTRWLEEEAVSGSGPYGFHPDATILGEKYGEGEYLILEASTVVPSYLSARSLKVVADRYYRDATDDEDAE